jgi:hypothetical protein
MAEPSGINEKPKQRPVAFRWAMGRAALHALTKGTSPPRPTASLEDTVPNVERSLKEVRPTSTNDYRRDRSRAIQGNTRP